MFVLGCNWSWLLLSVSTAICNPINAIDRGKPSECWTNFLPLTKCVPFQDKGTSYRQVAGNCTLSNEFSMISPMTQIRTTTRIPLLYVCQKFHTLILISHQWSNEDYEGKFKLSSIDLTRRSALRKCLDRSHAVCIQIAFDLDRSQIHLTHVRLQWMAPESRSIIILACEIDCTRHAANSC